MSGAGSRMRPYPATLAFSSRWPCNRRCEVWRVASRKWIRIYKHCATGFPCRVPIGFDALKNADRCGGGVGGGRCCLRCQITPIDPAATAIVDAEDDFAIDGCHDDRACPRLTLLGPVLGDGALEYGEFWAMRCPAPLQASLAGSREYLEPPDVSETHATGRPRVARGCRVCSAPAACGACTSKSTILA